MEESIADIDRRVTDLDKQVAVLASQRDTTDGLVTSLSAHVEALSTRLSGSVNAIRDQLTQHIADEGRTQRAILGAIILTLVGVIANLIVVYYGPGVI